MADVWDARDSRRQQQPWMLGKQGLPLKGKMELLRRKTQKNKPAREKASPRNCLSSLSLEQKKNTGSAQTRENDTHIPTWHLSEQRERKQAADCKSRLLLPDQGQKASEMKCPFGYRAGARSRCRQKQPQSTCPTAM